MKSFVCFSFFITSMLAASVTITLYTQERIDSFVEKLAAKALYIYEVQDSKIYIHDMLNTHYDALDENGRAPYKTTEGAQAHTSWKSTLLNNPELAMLAIEEFGPYIIRQLNSRLNYKALKSKNPAKSDVGFEESRFWMVQLEQIKSYQRLIEVLLELPDTELNYFITTNNSNASSFEFNQFLLREGVVNNIEYSPSRRYYDYPGDLILLVKRTSEHNENWTPKRCLNTANDILDGMSDLITFSM